MLRPAHNWAIRAPSRPGRDEVKTISLASWYNGKVCLATRAAAESGSNMRRSKRGGAQGALRLAELFSSSITLTDASYLRTSRGPADQRRRAWI